MPILDSNDLADLRSVVTETLDGSVVVWRAPATSGGTAKVGSATAIGTVTATIYPQPIEGRLVAPDEGLAGGRVVWRGIFSYGAGVRVGDEIRNGTVRYKVQGIAEYQTAALAELEELRA